jgi:hypothetical protein
MAARTGRGNTPARSMRIPDELWADALAESERRGETVTDAVVRFLRRYTKAPDSERKGR